jgi:hypothetical protein
LIVAAFPSPRDETAGETEIIVVEEASERSIFFLKFIFKITAPYSLPSNNRLTNISLEVCVAIKSRLYFGVKLRGTQISFS